MRNPADNISATSRRGFLAGSLAGTAYLLPQFARRVHADDPLSQLNTKHKSLIVRTEDPANAEPALDDLVKSWITPVEHFYVRSHAPVPDVNVERFELSVEGLVERPMKLSLTQLQDRFRKTSVVATLTCAGNRRREHSQTLKVGGVQWAEGPIGNARWGGVALSEVLKAAGVKENASHVWFDSLDKVVKDDRTFPFGASIPLATAMKDHKAAPGAMLAWEMNGQPLPPDHGYPLRTVVPGYIGARSVKWLGKIIVSDRPSPNHFVATAYKLVTVDTPDEWQQQLPIYRYAVNSAICVPAESAKLKPGRQRLAGYALPNGGGEQRIERVEVSVDGGKKWQRAELTSPGRAFCWQLWQADVDLSAGDHRLMVRAIDTAGNVQPEAIGWNRKGYLFNAWHQVPVQVGS